MEPKRLLSEFKRAAWVNSASNMELFVQEVGILETEYLEILLQYLLKKSQNDEPKTHESRIRVFCQLVVNAGDRDLFLSIIRALKQADPTLASALIGIMPSVNNVSFHNEIIALLRNGDSRIRRLGAEVFAKIPGKTAFHELSDLCAISGFSGRRETINVLVKVGGRRSLAALAGVIKVGTGEEKLFALELLKSRSAFQKRPGECIPLVAKALTDPAEEVVLQAIATLGNLATEEEFLERLSPNLDSSDITLVKNTILAMGRYSSVRVLQLFSRLFNRGPRAIRMAIIDSVESAGDDVMLPILVEGLTHKHVLVRTRAAEAVESLSESGRIDAARAVLWLLRSEDVNVKRIAAQIANRIKDVDGQLWPQLFRFLKDEDWWVRERLTDALINLAGNKLTPFAVAYLSDESEIIRRYGIDLLVKLSDPDSIGALVRAASEDEDWWVKERAIEALGKLEDKRAVPYILDIMSRSKDCILVSITALSAIGDDSASSQLAALIPEGDQDVKLEVVRALKALEAIDEAPALVEMLESDETPIQAHVEAKQLLAQWRLRQQYDDDTGGVSRGVSALDKILIKAVKVGGDDLMLIAGQQPFVKRFGKIVPLTDEIFTPKQVEAILGEHLSTKQWESLEKLTDVDFSYEVKQEKQRFRVNVFNQDSGLAAVFRSVKNEIMELETLGLPDIVEGFGNMEHGLVLIGGPTGAGKSTTLSALIQFINKNYSKKIITLEDPVEMVYEHGASMITQREVGQHTLSFSDGLRASFREDPDVILVGEMRDRPTLYSALMASETGHLVFGTLHTVSADTSIDRIINAFPQEGQPQIRSILANNLRAICCQHLLPRIGGGRVLAVEVMLNNDAIANLIRKGHTFQIPNAVATSRDLGMESMDIALLRLVKEGKIHAEQGYLKAINKKDFATRLAKEGIDDSFIESAIDTSEMKKVKPIGNVAVK